MYNQIELETLTNEIFSTNQLTFAASFNSNLNNFCKPLPFFPNIRPSSLRDIRYRSVVVDTSVALVPIDIFAERD